MGLCGSGRAREHRRSRCQPLRWILRGHARSHRNHVALANAFRPRPEPKLLQACLSNNATPGKYCPSSLCNLR